MGTHRYESCPYISAAVIQRSTQVILSNPMGPEDYRCLKDCSGFQQWIRAMGYAWMLCLGYSLVLGRLCRGSDVAVALMRCQPAVIPCPGSCCRDKGLFGREHWQWAQLWAGEHGLSYWAGVLRREGVPCTACVDLIVRPVTPVLTALPWWREGFATWIGSASVIWGNPLFDAHWGGLLLHSFPMEAPQCEILLSKGFCSSLSNLES